MSEDSIFIGELEHMDLSELKDKVFGVALGTGKRHSKQFLCTTLKVPLNFYEMVEMVGRLYEKELVHAKAFICSSTPKDPLRFLSENTIDFIEATYGDIIMDGVLGGELENTKEYTCKAAFVDEDIDGEETTERDSNP